MRNVSERVLAIFALFLVVGCGGGHGSTAVPSAPNGSGGGGGSPTAQATNAQAVSIANGVGTSLANFSSYDESISSTLSASSVVRGRLSGSASGACLAGVEFFAPDVMGTPNSTESKLFYDAACTQLARDIVRVYSLSGDSTETVARTVELYVPGAATATVTRTSTETLANATFDQHGFPIAADGFTRSSVNSLEIGSAQSLAFDDDLVVDPGATSGTVDFCNQSAGYSVTGSAALGETFGFSGGAFSGGTLVNNGNGSHTYTATLSEAAYTGPIGALSLATESLQTSCPITSPAYSVVGGSAIGSYSIPIIATYQSGQLSSLSVKASLPDGYALAIATTPGVSLASPNFVVGTLSQGTTTTVATLSVDAFGDGTVSVVATGAVFKVTDWQISK